MLRVPRSTCLLFVVGLAATPHLARAAAWQPIASDDTPKPITEGYSLVYDSARHRMLAIAALHSHYGSSAAMPWEIAADPEADWTRLYSTGSPPWVSIGGYRPTTLYDPDGDRLIDYSGSDLGQCTLAGTPSWTPLQPAGTAPPIRSMHSAVYDPVGHRILVFGGDAEDGTNNRLNDVWALSLVGTPTWTQILPAGAAPIGRSRAGLAFDPVGNRLLVFGGAVGYRGSSPANDLWALALDGTPTWTLLSSGPASRMSAAVALDPARGELFVFGGRTSSLDYPDAWIYSIATDTWTQLDAGAGPAARHACAAAFDPETVSYVVMGGAAFGGSPFNDVWSIPAAPGASWKQVVPNYTSQLEICSDPALVWDTGRQRAVLYGGARDGNSIGDVHVLGGGLDVWTQVLAGGYTPALAGAAGVWDPVRDRLLIFGGEVLYPSTVLSASVSQLSGWNGTPTWSGVVPTGTAPLKRKYAAGAYDPVRDRILYFAGYPAANARNQLWSLALGGTPAWSLLAPAGTPPTQRWGHTMTYDPVRDRMIVFGGGDGGYSNGLYALSLSGTPTWTTLAGPGTPPPVRSFHAATYDPMNDRLIVWGGRGTGGVYLNDTWEYRFNGEGWSQMNVTAPAVGSAAAGVYDPTLHRMLVFGHTGALGARRDTWGLDLAGQVTGTPSAPLGSVLALEGATPNPTYAAPKIAFTLPDGAAAKLELIDLAGRRVGAADVGSLGAGRHVVDLGSRVAPGLYFARLSRGAETKVVRVCVMK